MTTTTTTFFLTTKAVREGIKVIGSKGPLRGRILTPIELSGDRVKLAESGEWYPQKSVKPLTEVQLRDATIRDMLTLVEGKSIVNLVASGGGVQFILEDNTRVGLDYTSSGSLKLSVIDALGKQVL